MDGRGNDFLSEFLEYAIAQNWVDVSRLDMDTQYADSSEGFRPSGGIYQPGAGKDILYKKLYKYTSPG